MATYSFSAHTEDDLVNGNLQVGSTFTMPSDASTTILVTDDDQYLSGDSYNNENADDHTGQTADIITDGQPAGNGGQIYAEGYFWVYDQHGNWYVMVEVEQEGSSQDYFTFYTGYGYTVPAEGAQLTVYSSCNVTSDWITFDSLDGGEANAPATIAGRLTFDDDGNDSEWNAETGSWDRGIEGQTVQLLDLDGNVIAEATTDAYGNYMFEVSAGDYRVKFPLLDGYQFSAKDAVSDTGSDSDADENGFTDVLSVASGGSLWNVDAGLKNSLSDGNEATTIGEDAGVVTLTNVLDNTIDPESGDPVVYAVWGQSGPMTGLVGQPVAGSDGGIFVINEDGSITFDTNGEFDYLNEGQTVTTDIWYCVKDAAGKIVESKYTVTIVGEEEPVVIDALDDSITVFESEGAGDTETLDDGTSSILANDTEDGATYAGDVVEVNGQTANVGAWIDLDKGRVKINADGSVDFDAAGDFEALGVGDSEAVTVDYTIKSAQQASQPQNVLLVIDISNSTVSIEEGSQNVFDGTGVGDVNGDGRADTVLDAQIVAAKALIDDLRSQGIDPSLVNVGIVTFSGVNNGAGSFNEATVDAATVGSFGLGDAGIEAALDGILSGAWTNYEAGLSEAEAWFAANAEAGDGNTMYFLSDGRPTTGFDGNGGYAEQDTSLFLDEAGRIVSDYGTSIHAIGVGANSSLEILDQLDTTGGAVQVTDAAALTAALLDTSDLIEAQDSATVTITVLGENVLADEGETATTDENTPVDIDNLLDNTTDPEAGDPTVVSAGGQSTANGAVTVAGSNGGVFTIDANGNASFDPSGAFDALNDGDTATSTASYVVEDATGATVVSSVTVTIEGISPPPPPIDAVDDFIRVTETETFGDTEAILDSLSDTEAAANILANDDDNGTVPSEVATVIVNGVEGNIGEFITIVEAGEPRGRVKVNADGTVDFDANGNFDALNDGESDAVTFDYTIQRPGAPTTESRTIDFDSAGMAAGDVITGAEGVTISAVRAGDTTGTNQAMLFDTGNPTGGDTDLATSNLGNVLIISEDGNSGNPDDNAGGGTFVFDFDAPTTVETITFLDTEEPVPTVRFYDEAGALISEQNGPVTVDGGQETAEFNVSGVAKMEIQIQGSGAIDNVALTETVDGVPEVAQATVTVVVDGITDNGPPGGGDPDPIYTLKGDVVTESAETQTVTFVIDHSFEMFRRQSSEATTDANGDNSQRVIDAILTQIATAIDGANYDPGQEIHFVLAGENAPVSQLTLTAGALSDAIAANDLASKFSQAFAQADGSEVNTEATNASLPYGKAVNFAEALTAAKDYITSGNSVAGANQYGSMNAGFGANGADNDKIIVITATDGTDSLLEYNGLENGETTEQQLYWDLAAELEDDAGIDADIDVFTVNTGINLAEIGADYFDIAFNADGTVNTTVIDPDNVFDPLLLVELDSDGIINNASDADNFGLESLIEPATVTTAQVLSIDVGGEVFEVNDDLSVANFEVELTDLIVDPSTVDVFVNLDTNSDGAADTQLSAGTLIDLGDDTFQFSVNAVEELLV